MVIIITKSTYHSSATHPVYPELYKCYSRESTFVEFCVDGILGGIISIEFLMVHKIFFTFKFLSNFLNSH
jgi:hypothetical protein